MVNDAVAQTVHMLLHHLDSGEFEAASALFLEDGVWFRQGEPLTGPGGVLAALRTRPANVVTRHLVSNMIVTEDEGAVVATYQVLVFDHEGLERPAPLTGPRALFTLRDRLERTPAGWRFRERRPALVFKRP